WASHRAARVLTERDRAERGRGGDARAGGRAAWIVIGMPRIARLTVWKADRAAEGELGEVELADQDAARALEPRDDRRVFRRHVVSQERRSRCRQDPSGVELVLHREGNAVERPAPLPGRRLRFGSLCLGKRALPADRDECAQVLVESLDAIQIGGDQL